MSSISGPMLVAPGRRFTATLSTARTTTRLPTRRARRGAAAGGRGPLAVGAGGVLARRAEAGRAGAEARGEGEFGADHGQGAEAARAGGGAGGRRPVLPAMRGRSHRMPGTSRPPAGLRA